MNFFENVSCLSILACTFVNIMGICVMKNGHTFRRGPKLLWLNSSQLFAWVDRVDSTLTGVCSTEG